MTTLISKPSLRNINAGGIAAIEEVRSAINHLADTLRPLLSESAQAFVEGEFAGLWDEALEAVQSNPTFQAKKKESKKK